MKDKYIKKTIKIYFIPIIITIIISIILGFMLNSFASNEYKKMYINNSMKMSEYQAEKVAHNKEDEIMLIASLESTMRSAAETVLESRTTITNQALSDFASNFNFWGIHFFNDSGVILNSSIEDFVGVQAPQESYVQQFIQSGEVFHSDGVRPSDESGNHYMFIYLKDETDNYFVQISVPADQINELISRNSYQAVVGEIFDEGKNIISVALIDSDLNILATSKFQTISEIERTREFYNDVLVGSQNYRIRYSTNHKVNVLEVLTPVKITDTETILISTLYSLLPYHIILTSISVIVFALALSITIVAFSLVYFYIVRPLSMIEQSISTFNPLTGAYLSPKKDYGIFGETNKALKQLSNHIKESNEELLRLNSELYEQSVTDFLTKLANRRSLIYYLNKKIKDTTPFTILFIDLDGFKMINDTKGHEVGDLVLIDSAKIFKELCENCNYFVSRYGGDEFIIVIDQTNNEEVENFIEHLFITFKNNNTDYAKEIGSINLSVGVVKYPENGDTTSELIRKADLATYIAKEHFGHKHIYYYDHLDEIIQEETKIKNIIEEEMVNDGFKIVLQPQVNIHTNEIVSLEALARFKNHQIYPNQFIKIAEKYNIINQLGLIIIDKAIEALVAMRENNVKLKTIYINFSAKQLKNSDVIFYLLEKLKEHNIENQYIGIEITESAIIENEEQSKRFFLELKELGFKLAIDDFGSGSASISYLIKYPLALVKLDRSFSNLYLNEEQIIIYQTIVKLAKNLNYEVLAEGIETKDDVNLLKQTECNLVQGYYYYKPMELKEIIILLKK